MDIAVAHAFKMEILRQVLSDDQLEVLITGLKDLIEIDENALKDNLDEGDIVGIKWHIEECQSLIRLFSQ